MLGRRLNGVQNCYGYNLNFSGYIPEIPGRNDDIIESFSKNANLFNFQFLSLTVREKMQ